MTPNPTKRMQETAGRFLERGDIHDMGDGRYVVGLHSKAATGRGYEVINGKCDNCTPGRNLGFCSHTLAVQLLIEKKTREVRITPTDGRAMNWSAYNEAKAQHALLYPIFLRDLIEIADLPELKPGPGNPSFTWDERLYASIFKVGTRSSGRLATGEMQKGVTVGALGGIPHVNIASETLNHPETKQHLERLLVISALPLRDFETQWAVDSTGFRTTGLGGLYHQQRHKTTTSHLWRKAHLAVGVTTHIVAHGEITDSDGVGTGDTSLFAPLVRKLGDMGFTIADVVADAAYSSRVNVQAVYDAGGLPFIKFKSNSRPRRGRGTNTWWRAWHFAHDHLEEWEQRYHRRSNVESAISSIKRVHGETLLSRKKLAQDNELLCKLINHNIAVLIRELFANGRKPHWLDPIETQPEEEPMSQENQ